jgi:plasmid stabilization system protein ParE
MNMPLVIMPEAESDLVMARGWYEGKRPGLGEEFLLCVEAGLEPIRRAPEAAREVQPGVRRVVVRRFPYGIYYRIDRDQIAVLAVYHTRRDPRGWQQRS